MAVTQYVGARYVPIFADPAEWSSAKQYEPLTIVLHDGNSFTSKQFVPIGVDIDDTDYWAMTGNYNAQVELYRQETARVADDLDDTNAILPSEEFSSTNTVKKYIDNGRPFITPEMFGAIGDGIADDTQALQNAIDASIDEGATLLSTGKTYKLTSTLIIDQSRGFFNIDLGFSTLDSTAIIAVQINTPARIGAGSTFKNAIIKCDSNNVGMLVNARQIYISNVVFMNVTRVGLQLETGYEITVSNCNFLGRSNAAGNTAIKVNAADNYVHHCFGVDNTIFIENNAVGNYYESCHAWCYTPAILADSIFLTTISETTVVDCVADTYHIGFKLRVTSTIQILNCRIIVNPDVYNSSTYNYPPYFMYFDLDMTVLFGGNINISNNYVSFVGTEISGLSTPGYFSNCTSPELFNGVVANTTGYNYHINGYLGQISKACALATDISGTDNKVEKRGKQVTLDILLGGLSNVLEKNVAKNVATIPLGMRPKNKIQITVFGGATQSGMSTPIYLYLDSSGVIWLTAMTDMLPWFCGIHLSYQTA